VSEQQMNFSLVVVGANTGERLGEKIEECLKRGAVLLIEPVPWIFEKLKAKHGRVELISLLEAVISESDADQISFFAPTQSANEVAMWGDQLGSLSPVHAISHSTDFAGKIEEIKVKGLSFRTLIEKFQIENIDSLCIDTEGYDSILLRTFPFEKIKPKEIIFEYKHSDGIFNIGKNFANVLTVLDESGYRTQVISEENCRSILTTQTIT
jgi:FkbM family methyltransferase